LRFHSTTTGLSREITQGALSTLDVFVNSSDLVFYEVDEIGQGD
jgi:hypothetical protein